MRLQDRLINVSLGFFSLPMENQLGRNQIQGTVRKTSQDEAKNLTVKTPCLRSQKDLRASEETQNRKEFVLKRFVAVFCLIDSKRLIGNPHNFKGLVLRKALPS